MGVGMRVSAVSLVMVWGVLSMCLIAVSLAGLGRGRHGCRGCVFDPVVVAGGVWHAWRCHVFSRAGGVDMGMDAVPLVVLGGGFDMGIEAVSSVWGWRGVFGMRVDAMSLAVPVGPAWVSGAVSLTRWWWWRGVFGMHGNAVSLAVPGGSPWVSMPCVWQRGFGMGVEAVSLVQSWVIHHACQWRVFGDSLMCVWGPHLCCEGGGSSAPVSRPCL